MKIMKKASFVAIGLAAVASMSLASALWADQTSVNGSLSTGQLLMGWDDGGQVVDNEDLITGDAGQCSNAISGDQKTVTFTITNAYPGYRCVMDVSVANLGTVPAKVTNVAFGAHNPAIQMLDSHSLVQTGSILQAGTEGNFKLTVTVDPLATEAQIAELTNNYSVPVTLQFANISGLL